ncbi:glycine betaine ABC transporter substrate-binding protein [Oceanobacillus halotolerans]|uniref:glycine betaine ABC transporter substrate-binding protein n=1 Tax=Oceanobacillus halotolerans TaxID=2663380 RepID=UPI0013DAEED3|nr:glycine betaine ABC transporter substrate-binding protein [Oceanobacillus halotolerans]
MKLLQFSLLLTAIILVGCSDDSSASTEDKDPIIFADNGWDSNRFYNELAGIIIENGYGYETDQISGSTPALFTGIAENEVDVHMEVWTQNVGDTYTEGIENGDFNKLSLNFDDNHQGLYVPSYVIEGDPERGIEPMAPDLEYITDLPEYWEIFQDPEDNSKGRIIGSISGWEVDEILHDGFLHYGLDEYYNYFRPGSEAALNVSLETAYENGEPWIGYNYEPNWVMGKFDMIPIMEEDENGVLESIGAQNIDIIASSGLMERAPEVTDFLSNVETSSEIANNALIYIQEEEATEYEAAVHFLKENEDLWTQWVPEDVVESIKEAIN